AELSRLYAQQADEAKTRVGKLKDYSPVEGAEKDLYDKLLKTATANLNKAEEQARDYKQKLAQLSSTPDSGAMLPAARVKDPSKPADNLNATISGVVTDSDNNPLSNVLVELKPEPGQVQIYSRRTDQKGEYTIAGVIPGKYILTAAKDGYLTKTLSNHPLLEAGKVNQTNIILSTSLSTLSLKFVDVDEEPIPNVRISIKHLQNSGGSVASQIVITDTKGATKFTNLAPGQYQVTAEGTGFSPNTESYTLQPGQTEEKVYSLQRPDAIIRLKIIGLIFDGK